MSEEDLTNYKTYINNFDITKHVILDKENNYWYSAEYVDKMLKKQDKEIERLNNIINELDTWLKEKVDSFKEDEYVSTNIEHERLAIKMVYYYLQELKGSE